MDVHTLLFIKAPKWKQSKCPSVVEWIHMCSLFFKDLWFICLFYFWPGGSSLLYLGFILLQRMGATLYCAAQASHCSGLFVAQTLGCTGFSSCGFQALEHGLNSWAQGLSCTWDLPEPGIELVSPVLQGRVSTTRPPERPIHMCSQGLLNFWNNLYLTQT